MNRIESAMEFIELGCRVGPVDGKHPGGYLGADWHLKFTRDPELAATWFTRWPLANVGILPDKAVIPVDVDAWCGYEALVYETQAPSPMTPEYLTGGGDNRKRLLFAYDERIQAADRKLAPGVQLRHWVPGSALMSVVPPGVHAETGADIEWITALDEVPLAPLPEAWLERVARPGRGPARPPAHWADLAARPPAVGDRHETLLSLAGHLIARDVHPRVAAELLCGWAAGRCTVAGERSISDQEVAEAVLYCAKREAVKRG
jgi:Bifunctional DNA primase/polymerase, N-terminal